MSGAVRMDRRLYLTADRSRAVEEGDPEAATLLCPAGGEVPHATAARYGLLPDAPSAEQGDGEDTGASEPEAEEKAQRQVPNKARTRAANKES